MITLPPVQRQTMNPSPVTDLQVPAERAGQRLDNFLLGALKDLPRALIYRLLRQGAIRVDGRRARPEERVRGGERITLPPLKRRDENEKPVIVPTALAQKLKAAVIFENADFLVIDKPAGMASHSGSGVRIGLVEALRSVRNEPELSLAHRLDRETSGILVFARRREALLAVHQALRAGAVEKRYIALLAGRLHPSKLEVNHALARERGGMVRTVEEGRAARSVFERLETYRDATLCAITISTGRTHQIRVHAAAIAHPVLGDPRYGDFALNRAFKRRFGLERMFLHAAYLSFPWGEGSLDFSAPLPSELAALLERLPR